MSALLEEYEKAVRIPCDINEHVPVLYGYAKQCSSVLELGTGQRATASWGFVRGLAESDKPGEKRMLAVDLTFSKSSEKVAAVCKQQGITYTFVTGNDLDPNFPGEENASFDLVFIDTWHIYGQLKRELAKYAPLTNKYIIMHDTEIDGVHGEVLRMGGGNAELQEVARNAGMQQEELTKGLLPAIDEFLAANKEWVIVDQRMNNKGLTILGRLG